MGKGGGKGGKSGLGKALGLVGAVAGFAFPGMFGISSGLLWVQRTAGAIMGLSLGQTIGSALDPIDQETKTSSFDSKMNTVDSDARIPLVYGTRMIGGLQSWHQTNSDDKWLIKDVILGEGQFSGAYGLTANGYLLKPNGNIPTVVRQYTTNSHYMSSISTGNNPVFGLINWKYPDASVEIKDGGWGRPTDEDKQLILRWGSNEAKIWLQDPVDLNDDSSNDYNCSFSLLYQYLEGIHYDTNFAAEGWQVVNPVVISDPPEDLATCSRTGCYQKPVMFRLESYDATNDSWIQFFDGTQGAPEYYEKSGAYPNMAYLHAYLKYSDKLGAGNPTVVCIAHGRKIYDTRTGKTDYSENPAMIVRDFLINRTFGAGHFITADMLDEDSFKDVADYCDEIITNTDGAGRSITEPRYRLNIVVNEKQTYLETLQNMLACFAGFLVFTNGKVALKVEKAESAVYSFTDDNIIADSISYKADSTADSPNRYNVKYIEPNLNWTAVPVIVEDLVSQAASPVGRGKIISKDVELIGVTSQSQASRLGKIYRDLVRLCPVTMTFKTGMQGMHLEPGDVVLVSHKMVVEGKEVDLFKDMPVRILQIQDDNGEYTLTCRQYNASIYDDRFGGNLQLHSYTPIQPGDEEEIMPTAVPQPENLSAYTVYKQGPDGAVAYDLVVKYDLPDGYGIETGLVYYKTNEDYDLENTGVIEEDVPADEIGFSREWKYAGDAPGEFVFSNVNLGVTYKIMVRCRNINGGMSSEVGAPTVTVTIARKTEVPNIPSNFSVVFGTDCKFTWDAVTNSDIDFYELRYDDNAGAEEGLIARTTDTSISVKLAQRTGKIYLFAHNATKSYGYPAVLEYSKEEPPAPRQPKLATKLGGFSIEADPIPNDCLGMVIYISAAGGGESQTIATENNTYSYMCGSGMYDVRVAYKDIFGEGPKSQVASVLVKVLVDSDMLDKEAVSLDKVDKVIQDAVKDAQESVGKIDDINNQITNINQNIQGVIDNVQGDIKDAIDSVNQDIQGVIDELNKAPSENGFKSINELQRTADSLSSTIANNKQTQDGINDTNLSLIKQNASQIETVVANLNKEPDGTGYKAISSLQQTAEGIASTVQKYKEDQDGTNSSLESSISQINQKADSISSTVQQNKQTQDGINQNYLSLIQQNANKIQTVVTNLDKDPSQTGYKAISSLQQTAEGIASTVQSTKSELENDISLVEQKANQIQSTVQSNKATQDKTNQNLSSQITQTSDRVTSVITNLGDVDAAKANYSAIAQLQNDINLRVKGDDIISQINLNDQGNITIDGKYIHVTGDTIFDNNVIANGMIQAGAISADKLAAQDIAIGVDPTTGIVGGAVRLDENGLTVTGDNGTSVVFDDQGMSFKDSLGNRFAGIGRFCTGLVNDGDTVRFNNPWDVVPSVFVFPTNLQTSAVGYSNVDILQQVFATNVSKNGFSVVCRSILKSGSNGFVSLNKQVFSARYPNTSNQQNFTSEYTFSVPTTATTVTVEYNATINIYGSTTGGDNGGLKYGGRGIIWITWKSGSTVLASEELVNEIEYTGSSTNRALNLQKTLNFKNISSITMHVRGFFERKGIGLGGAGGTVTINNYHLNTNVDTIIAHGSAGFIAVDPNTCAFTVS